jgi:hypothetical protein
MNFAQQPNQQPPADTIPSGAPQVVPMPGIGPGHSEYHFVQGLMEIQKSMVELHTDMKHLTKTVDGLKTKVEDLIRIKNLVFGGAIVLGTVITIAVGIVKLGSEYVMLKPSVSASTQAAEAAPAAPVEPSKGKSEKRH